MSYPISLKLRGKTCVVVGGGTVAARKVRGLLQAGASVVVISPMLDASLRESVDAEEFRWLRVHWQPKILQEVLARRSSSPRRMRKRPIRPSLRRPEDWAPWSTSWIMPRQAISTTWPSCIGRPC